VDSLLAERNNRQVVRGAEEGAPWNRNAEVFLSKPQSTTESRIGERRTNPGAGARMRSFLPAVMGGVFLWAG